MPASQGLRGAQSAEAWMSGIEPPITIAVVSWNTRALLHSCLESLRRDAESGVVDVWVVDNASTDGSADLVRDAFPWVNLIASTCNLGFGRAVNLVAAHTATPWIEAANADIELDGGAISALLSAGARHPRAGALAPRLILPDGATQHSAFPFPTVTFTLAFAAGLVPRIAALRRRWCIGEGFEPETERDVPWAVGAFLLVRREAWDEAGGFDGDQWMYAEDLDLGWRLARSRWTTRYVPTARIEHHESAATSKAWGSERYARWHASTYVWLTRRRGAAVARLIAAINVAGFTLRRMAWAPAARTGNPSARQRAVSARDAARAHRVGLRARPDLERLLGDAPRFVR